MKEDASIKDESKRFAGRPKVEITAESIRKFFRLVNQRNYEKATKLGLEILTNAGKDELSESSAVEEAEKSMTLFASSFTSLLSDPSFNLSEVGLRAFLVNKSSLRRTFLGTSFKDMSHLFGLMGSGSDGQSVISEKDWWRLMIAMSLDNLQETLFPIIESLSSSSQLLLWVSLMDNKWLVTEKEQRNLDRLLSMA